MRISFIAVCLICFFTNWTFSEQSNITISSEKIDSTIKFLQDSARVNSLINELKMLETAKSVSETTVQAVEKWHGENISQNWKKPGILSVNFFNVIKKSKGRFVSGLGSIFSEIRSIPEEINNLKYEFGLNEYRERLVSLIIIICIAFVIGSGASIGASRIARRYRQTIPFKGGVREAKLSNAVYEFFESISRWIGVAAGCLILASVPENAGLGVFFRNASIAFLMYASIMGLLNSLLSSRQPQFRIVILDSENSNRISRWCRVIMRFSLVMYLLFIATHGKWPAAAVGISVIYEGIGAFVLSAMLFRIRGLHVIKEEQKTSTVSYWREIPRRLFSFILSNLYIIAFLYLAVLTVLHALGYNNIHSFIITATLKTFLILIITGIVIICWQMVINRIVKAGSGVTRRYPDLQNQINFNISLLRNGVFVITGIIVMFFTFEVWGLNIGRLLRSDVPIVRASIHILAIALVSFAILQVSFFLISRFQKEAMSRMLSSSAGGLIEVEKRVSTLGGISRKIVTVSVLVIAIMMIMEELGFDIKAMLAGVGIVGIAVGFGAQNFVRDVISGLFLIFENRIRVGDVAVINGTGGNVEQVNLRTTVLRGVDGTVHVFPNGAINSLSNMTHEFSYYVFDISVAYRENVDRVMDVLRKIGDEILMDNKFKDAILAPLEVFGLDKFGDSAVVVKARIKTLPIRQWDVGREMNRRIKSRFEEMNIEIPFPQNVVSFDEKNGAISVKMDGASMDKEEIRKIVGEMLDERRAGIDSLEKNI